MTITPEIIAARREILALLVEARPRGLSPDVLAGRCCRRVKGLTDKQARAVITTLASGGMGRGYPQIHKKSGRWMTHSKVAPPPVKLVPIEVAPTMRERQAVTRNGLREKLVSFLEERGTWVTKPDLVAGVGRIPPRLLQAVVDEGLVARAGVTRSTRYSVASLQLPLPEHLGGPVAPGVVAGGREGVELFVSGRSVGQILTPTEKERRARLERAIAKARGALDELETALKAA